MFNCLFKNFNCSLANVLPKKKKKTLISPNNNKNNITKYLYKNLFKNLTQPNISHFCVLHFVYAF